MLALCDRWHKLPEEILAADASMLQMIKIVDMARPRMRPAPSAAWDDTDGMTLDPEGVSWQ